MVLGVVFLVLMFLIGIILAYNNIMRSQNLLLHHGTISEVTSTLAMNGGYFLAEVINQQDPSVRETLQAQALSLFKPVDAKTLNLISGKTDINGTPRDPNNLMSRVAGDYQKVIKSYSYGKFIPRVEEMGLSFTNMERLKDPSDPDNLAAGFDAVERRGMLTLSCKVSFRGLTRQANISRQFKIVNMISGPWCRFTLFSIFNPGPQSYNTVRNQFDGSWDDRTVFNSESYSAPSFRPLVCINGTDTVNLSGGLPLQDATKDLQTRGWVFLGMCPTTASGRNPTALNGPVHVRIPSGFLPDPGMTGNSGIGGHTYLSFPTQVGGGIVGNFPYPISDPDLLKTPTPIGGPYQVHTKLQGFFTFDATLSDTNNSGVRTHNLWVKPDGTAITADDMSSSWVLPFGIRFRPSRTLVAGPAYAEFLQYYMLTNDANKKGILVGQDSSTYDPDAPVKTIPALTGAAKNADIFQTSTGEPKPGFEKLRSIRPRWWAPVHGSAPMVGVALNMIFDLMGYGILPDLNNSKSRTGGIGMLPGKSQAIPGLNSLNSENPPCHLPVTNIQLSKSRSGSILPSVDNEETIFFGDLRKLNFGSFPFNSTVQKGLYPRVTQIIDLSGINDHAQQMEILGSRVFSKVFSGGSLVGYEFNRPGIYLILRQGTDSEIVIDKPIKLNKSGILILERKSIMFKGGITSSDVVDGVSRHLFSIIALDGNIYVPPNTEINAYLVALSKGTTESPGVGGRVLATTGTGSSNTNKLDIRGGMAVFELTPDHSTSKPSTMENFKHGGTIQYNPYFNPCSPAAEKAYILAIDDKNSSVSLTGAE
ncbi:MAG: hypothetical protein HQM10_07360 [Candidatus Riflebacteria bacterium]|nr:hypothetical protein [Candidatus Riflebacteria bacterium]